jgi:hypothetical protein
VGVHEQKRLNTTALKHCGYYMYHLLYHLKTLCFPTEYVYDFCMTFRVMNNYFAEQHSLVGLCVFCEVKGKLKFTL